MGNRGGVGYRRSALARAVMLAILSSSVASGVFAYDQYNDTPIGWYKFTGKYDASSGTLQPVYVLTQDPSEVCEHETTSEGHPKYYHTVSPLTGAVGNFCIADPIIDPAESEASFFRPACKVLDDFPYTHTNVIPQWDGEHQWHRPEKIFPDNYGPGPFICPAPEWISFPVRDMTTGWVRSATTAELSPPPAPPDLPDLPDPPDFDPDPTFDGPTPFDLGSPDMPGMCVGDPIVPATGEVLEIISDYEDSSVDPIKFDRIYRSQWSSGKNTGSSTPPLGAQWSHNYSSTLKISAGQAQVRLWDGSIRSFIIARSTGEWMHWGKHSDILIQSPAGWIYRRMDDGSTWLFDGAGKLLSIIQRNGWSKNLTYTEGKLTRIQNNFGRALTFSYDSAGRLSRVSSASGTAADYGYDASGRLVEVTRADGSKNSYFYESAKYPDALTAISDEYGVRYVEFAYDSLGRAIDSQNPGGVGRYSVAYAGAEMSASSAVVIDPLGTERTYEYKTERKLVVTSASKPEHGSKNSINRRLFSDSGFIETDFLGRQSSYLYADHGRIYQKNIAFNTPERRVESTDWHQTLPIKMVITEPGRKTTNIYNGQPDPFDSNRPAKCTPSDYVLPDGGAIAVLCKRVVQATNDRTGEQGAGAKIDTNVAARVWTWTYDENGQLLSSKDPLGAVSTRSYYLDATSTHTKGDLRSVTNAMGHTTMYTAYDSRGNLLSAVDPNGVETAYTYDLRNRTTSFAVGGEATQFAYKPTGKIGKVVFPNGDFVQYEYDAAHRLVGMSDAAGNTISYTLDNMGNRILTSVKDPAGNLARSHGKSIDALGRVVKTTGAGE